MCLARSPTSRIRIQRTDPVANWEQPELHVFSDRFQKGAFMVVQMTPTGS